LSNDFLAQLALAGDTSDVIDWAKMRSLDLPALGKNEGCKLLLDAANGVALPPAKWNQLVGMTILSGPDKSAIALDADRARWLDAELSKFLTATKQERSRMFDTAKSVANAHTFLAPVDSTRAKAERPLIAENLTAGLVYWLQIIFDPAADGFAAKLSRCHYSECRAFFFARPARGGVGRPSTRYCSAAHVKLGVLEQARQRMKEYRK
jgi:hypothetical protein